MKVVGGRYKGETGVEVSRTPKMVYVCLHFSDQTVRLMQSNIKTAL
jgi:hypothetical protein